MARPETESPEEATMHRLLMELLTSELRHLRIRNLADEEALMAQARATVRTLGQRCARARRVVAFCQKDGAGVKGVACISTEY